MTVFAIELLTGGFDLTAQVSKAPTVSLEVSPTLDLEGDVDSNSPAVWDLRGGRRTLFVMTSAGGSPSLNTGPNIQRLNAAGPVSFANPYVGGLWIEAVIKDVDSVWYAYYHNEVADVCIGTGKTRPRLGAARSADLGETWTDLGIILEAPPGTERCATPNHYFTGGVGDFSVVLDQSSQDLYIFFSQYPESLTFQGVAIARLAWADRDAPQGHVTVWRDNVWMPASWIEARDTESGAVVGGDWSYPLGTPIYQATESWHDDDEDVDAFWGPSVHWNTYLERYVMLLNRAFDVAWSQEGVYAAFNADLTHPASWSTPQRIMKGGSWYPQVIGLEPGNGTDKTAGELARFYLSGRSDYIIRFGR